MRREMAFSDVFLSVHHHAMFSLTGAAPAAGTAPINLAVRVTTSHHFLQTDMKKKRGVNYKFFEKINMNLCPSMKCLI